MSYILQKLRGGDLRSIGRANEVVQEVEKNPALFEELLSGLDGNDPIIRMRSADVIEKVTQNKPELLSGFTERIISVMESVVQQEVCWHMSQIVPRLTYDKDKEDKIITILEKFLLHKSKIVKVSAIESLVHFAERNKSILNEVLGIIKEQITKGSPAVGKMLGAG